jgi:hypothetical protein
MEEVRALMTRLARRDEIEDESDMIAMLFRNDGMDDDLAVIMTDERCVCPFDDGENPDHVPSQAPIHLPTVMMGRP